MGLDLVWRILYYTKWRRTRDCATIHSVTRGENGKDCKTYLLIRFCEIFPENIIPKAIKTVNYIYTVFSKPCEFCSVKKVVQLLT